MVLEFLGCALREKYIAQTVIIPFVSLGTLKTN